MSTVVAIERAVDEMSPAELLAAVLASKRIEETEAARQLVLAAAWADLHPPESILDVAGFATPGLEREEPIAGPGCPAVAEFSIAEFGAVLGMSTTAAKQLVGQALELRHRLPRLWARLQAGEVPAWRARRVAEATIHSSPELTMDAAGWLDSQVAGMAERVGVAQLDRTVEEAITRFGLAHPDPTRDAEDGYLYLDRRHATVRDEHVGLDGTMGFEASLSIADALDLDHALAAGAAAFKTLGSEQSLDVRRSMALGDLARSQTALDLSVGDADATLGSAQTRTRAATAREVVLHVHLSADAAGDGLVLDQLGRLEERHRLLLLDQVRSWCGDTSTRVTIKPVIDLNAELETGSYVVPDRIRDQIALRDRTCTFPWCTRPARACDVDHVTPFDHNAEPDGRPQPGPTRSSNLTSLCRKHHRLKTQGRWQVAVRSPGILEWTSPHGHRYLRDHTGTRGLDTPARSSRTTRPPKAAERH